MPLEKTFLRHQDNNSQFNLKQYKRSIGEWGRAIGRPDRVRHHPRDIPSAVRMNRIDASSAEEIASLPMPPRNHPHLPSYAHHGNPQKIHESVFTSTMQVEKAPTNEPHSTPVNEDGYAATPKSKMSEMDEKILGYGGAGLMFTIMGCLLYWAGREATDAPPHRPKQKWVVVKPKKIVVPTEV